MRQRIVSGLQWMVAVTAMLISGAVFWQQSQLLAELRHARQEDAAERRALTAKLDRLEIPAATAAVPVAPSSDPNSPPAYDPYAARPESVQEPGPSASMPQSDAAMRYSLPEARPMPPSENDPAVLTLSFVQETADGPPVSPRSVSLTSSDGREYELSDAGYYAGAEQIDPNKVVFRSLEPDLYQLRVRLADGQCSERLVSIRDEKPRELTIVCPGPRTQKAPVSISIKPLPDWMQKKPFKVVVEVSAAPVEIGQAKWAAGNLPVQSITFDAETGLPVEIAAMSTSAAPVLDLRDLPAEERWVFLPVGAVAYWFEVHEQPVLGPVPVYQWPDSPEADGALRHVIEANENTWALELPQEFLDGIARNLGGSEPPPIDLPPSDPVPDAAPDPAQELSEVLARLQGVWTPVASPGGVSEADAEQGAITIAGETAARGDGKVKCKIAVNGAKSPWWIDIGNSALLSLYNPNDPSAEEPLEGIVRLEGDTLTMSLARQGQRPAKFDEPHFPTFVFKRKPQP